MNEMKNKIKAVMIGHAIGDALGVPVEKAPAADGYEFLYTLLGLPSDC